MDNRIKEARKARGISQGQLAEMIGTGRSTIAKLEGGERRLSQDWMDRIATALGCSIIDLLPVSGIMAENDDEKELIRVFRSLNDEQRAELLEIGELKLRRRT